MIENIFITPVYVTDLKLDNKAIYDECIKYKKRIPKGKEISNRGGYQSQNVIGDNISPFDELGKSIVEHAKLYSNAINLKISSLKDLWFNINYHKDYNVIHNHFGQENKFSGVYYVEAPYDCGMLELNHPDKYIDYSWTKYTKDYNNYTGSNWKYEPIQSRLIMFPSWIEHSVETNLSESPRVSFSFNLI